MFGVYKSFASLVKFILNYFIIFDAIVNGIVLLIFISHNLMLVCRSAIDFCMLILYPATLLNLFILTIFWWNLLSFVHIRSCPLWKEIIVLFVSNLNAFISFTCLFALVRISRTMLNISGKSGHSCLGRDLRGKALSVFHHKVWC